jgi:chitinase
VGGTANLAGTLDVDVTAYPPHTGDTIDVLTAGTRSGTFGTVVGQGFTVNYLPDRVRITPPTLTIGDRSVTEGDTGSKNLRFTVDLSSPSPGTVTVNYATSNGTAVAPADYTATSGTLTFAPGQTQRFIDVPVRGDLRDEVNETFNVTLSAPALADLSDGAAVGTITDNDPPPAISIDDVSAGEGGGSHTFTVSLSQDSGRTVRVDYGTADGSATAPADYTSKSGTLTFAPGDTSKTVTVNTVDDALDENDETFSVALSNPVLSTIADGSGTGTITDNDPTPSLSIDDAAGTEGASQTFTVTLSAASGRQVTVNYATADGTAVAPGDYAATSGTLTFAPGETTKTVNVNTVDDALDEANPQTYTLTLSNAAAATISDASGTGSISDNDPPVTVTVIDSPNRQEGDDARFDVLLSGPSEVQVRVDFATQDGSAIAPGDYTPRSGRLVFKPGVTKRRVFVSTVDDALDETGETFNFVISNPIKAIIADGSGSARIVDNDP